jgi:hypothetical protein
MPANSSLITITANGVTKHYVRLWNGLIEPYIPLSERKKQSGCW